MTAREILEQLAVENVRLEAEGGRLVLDAPEAWSNDKLLNQIAALKQEILLLLQLQSKEDSTPDREIEIGWRVEAMKRQMANHEGGYFPMLTAREDLTGKPGYCFSCGEILKPDESRYTCDLCVQAKYSVLGLLL